MSYILDALNKSEAERQQKRVPNLKSAHTPLLPSDSSRDRTNVLIALLAISVALPSAYLLRDSFTQSIPDEPGIGAPYVSPVEIAAIEKQSVGVISTSAVSQQAETTSAIDIPASTEIPVQTGQTPPDLAPGEELITPQTALAADSIKALPGRQSPIPEINALPAHIRARIPDLSFSTHIYATDASFRMVGINGRPRREGEMIANDLMLEQITEEGVVLRLGQVVFQMGVVRNWSNR